MLPASCSLDNPAYASEIPAYALPPEAIDTLQLIKDGGPFPFRQDGTTFHNFEGLLPEKPSGYYREYTVITPGSSDRGARRIVSGQAGEYYYTDDHYASFKLILK
ncbi:MAG: ribonuclease domain-containing protein [Dehalococcoidales bacterium]|nr:ribonuclease domain-containing protein [Dehalococcoidales bacterium]MDD3264822.1 ribonuclease domain-containing protein [Dehalococcoidales bacterium]MDD4322572.1 ribonuclease domain-containing protein [Dehalococcoidales bacterium]MDD4794363.1 ribonuclease domain-containing protein [Dehalococcoidales bacterium]MDD5122215.1 ribonuclease domain-containing protein [Dehalococcoidales bacterium]